MGHSISRDIQSQGKLLHICVTSSINKVWESGWYCYTSDQALIYVNMCTIIGYVIVFTR